MAGALVIATVFEVAGALIAGGDVVTTIQKGIISADAIGDTDRFIWLMMAALLAGAVWLNLATCDRRAGLDDPRHHRRRARRRAGRRRQRRGQLGPTRRHRRELGDLAGDGRGDRRGLPVLDQAQHHLARRHDRRGAAHGAAADRGSWCSAFSAYLVLKGLNRVWKTGVAQALGIGAVLGVLGWRLAIVLGAAPSARCWPTPRPASTRLFTLPLICAAALLSFAHGANDVANAVGPLAAIAEPCAAAPSRAGAPIPLWVMVVGAAGIAIGLMLYGPRMIRKVGSEITELDQMRAFCIAMSAAVTVIVASQLGLPVSSTHIAVGGVFGVGFLREFLKRRHADAIEFIRMQHAGADKEVVERFLDGFARPRWRASA